MRPSCPPGHGACYASPALRFGEGLRIERIELLLRCPAFADEVGHQLQVVAQPFYRLEVVYPALYPGHLAQLLLGLFRPVPEVGGKRTRLLLVEFDEFVFDGEVTPQSLAPSGELFYLFR